MARVLIIEDSPLVVEMLTMICKASGHHVESVAAFSQVSPALQSFEPELIITDLNLPDLPEENALVALREHLGLDEIPIIIISGQPRKTLLTIADQAGAQGALSKDDGMPVISAELPAMIEALL